jgi:hypothetical protein
MIRSRETDAGSVGVPAEYRTWLPLLISLSLLVLGAKLMLIKLFGGAVPYWDQWDAEGLWLYKPYVENNLNWSALIEPHNEHRILSARLLALFLFEVAGGWDPVLQMATNAVLHVAVILCFTVLIARLVPADENIPFIVPIAALFSLPFGWENSLAGFQSPFYFLLLFSFLALNLLAGAQAYSARWFAGLLFSIAAYFSLSSGALTPVAALIVVLLQLAIGSRARSWKEASSVFVMIAIAAIMIKTIPDLAKHNPYMARSVEHFALAFVQLAAAPFPWTVLGLLLHLPLLMVLVRFLREAKTLDPARWVFLAFAVWIGLQMASIAYGRAIGPTSSRYLDITMLLLVLDYVAVRILSKDFPRYANGLAAIWIGAAAIGIGAVAPTYFASSAERGRQAFIQYQNVSAYLATGDKAHISNKPFLLVPYPNSERLAAIASDPTVRMILPDAIRPPGETTQRSRHLLTRGVLAGIAGRIKLFVITYAALLLAAGFAICLFVALYRADRAMLLASSAPVNSREP